MLRHRSLRNAAAAAVTAATRDYATPSSQVWITISGDAQTLCGTTGGGAGKSWTLRVPLEVSTTSISASKAGSGPTGHGVLHRSRTLLAPHTSTPNDSNSATTGDAAAVRDPYTVSIDDALFGHNGGQQQAAATLRALVQLLVDPDAGNNIEDVSLRDFAAMATKRQLRAVANNAECLDVILQSERYQGERDARALRLAGITNVGQWHEQPDRVPLSSYGRGILESTYHAMTRTRQQSQQDSVVAWLTRTIQRAVAEELMAPKMLAAGGGQEGGSMMMHQLHPSSAAASGQRAEGGSEHVVLATSAAAAVTAKASQHAEDAARANAKASHAQEKNQQGDEEEEEGDADVTAGGGARRRGPRHRPLVSQVDKAAVKTAAAKAAETEDIIDEVAAEQGAEVDAEMATLMAEAEAILGGEEASAASKAAGTSVAKASNDADAAEEEEEVEEVVEEVEEEEMEEVEEDEEAPVATATAKAPAAAAAASSTPPTPTVAAAAAAAAPASSPAASPQQKEKLARLAELMLKQFNTADGYLHPTNKAERKEQEKRGDIVVLDEDTAQVDPLAMFSTYHAATVTEDDPVAVRALKTIWTSYNKHQVALEEAADEATAEFYKHESVNALLYGSVLMRALAREEPVMVLEGTSMPRYGFPLVSSDTRPFSATASSAAHAKSATDMTPGKVPTAMQAYKIFFNDKEKRYSPFRPAVDHNAGCSVVRLSGTTLHLYYTSTMDHVMEEEVRMPFAEVMLGMLHLLRQKVLPRVNVVHYHLIATKMADAAADTNFMLRSTATLDLTNPFTKEEHTRLKALAAPLGMAEEMDEFRCIDDLVMEIEENSGASVVHSLLHNREDLEATLTATLAQLLPEDADADSAGAAAAATTADAEGEDDASGAAAELEGDEEGAAEEEEFEEEEVEEEEVEEVPAAPPAPAGRKSKAAAAAAAAQRNAPAPQPEEEEEAVEEEDEAQEEEEEFEEDEEEGEAPVQRGGHGQKAQQPAAAAAARKPLHHPAPPVAPTTRRTSAAAAAAPKGDEEEAELEEAIFSQWRKQKEQQQQQHGKHPVSVGGGGSKSAAASRAAAQQQEEEEEFEEEEYEEKEEEAPVVTPAASKPRRGTASAAAAPASSRAAAPKATTPAIEEEEEEEDEEDVEIVKAPVLPRSPAGRRAVPVAQAVDDEEDAVAEEDEEELPPAPPRRAQQQQQQQRVARHPQSSPAPAPPRSAQPPRAARVDEDAEEEDAPPPLPLIRTRRGAARRHSSRAPVAPQTEETGEESASAGVSDEGGADGQEAAPVAAAEDQWFRKKPKRRYFE